MWLSLVISKWEYQKKYLITAVSLIARAEVNSILDKFHTSSHSMMLDFYKDLTYTPTPFIFRHILRTHTCYYTLSPSNAPGSIRK